MKEVPQADKRFTYFRANAGHVEAEGTRDFRYWINHIQECKEFYKKENKLYCALEDPGNAPPESWFEDIRITLIWG